MGCLQQLCKTTNITATTYCRVSRSRFRLVICHTLTRSATIAGVVVTQSNNSVSLRSTFASVDGFISLATRQIVSMKSQSCREPAASEASVAFTARAVGLILAVTMTTLFHLPPIVVLVPSTALPSREACRPPLRPCRTMKIGVHSPRR